MRIAYDLITILPFSLLTILLFGGYAGVPVESPWGYGISVFLTAGFILLRHMKTKHRLSIIGIVSVFLIGLCFAAGEEYWIRFLTDDLWVVWILCFSAGALLLGSLTNHSIWIRRCVSVSLLAYCIAGTILSWAIGKNTFALVCLLLLFHTAEEIQRKWQKSGYPDRKEHIARITPMLLGIVVLAISIPVPEEPYDWKFVKELYARSVSTIQRIYGTITHPSDEYGKVGFSDKGVFLSGLSGNDDEVLSIQVNHTSVRNFCLVGCISGEFRGREWVFDTEKGGASRMMDTIETTCAVKKYAPDSRTDYLQKLDMDYENLFYNTKYIFSPDKIKLEVTREQFPGITELNGSVLSKKKLHYQDKYRISCYVLNYANPHMEELLNHAEPISETEWDQTLIAEKASGLSGFSFEDYQNYRKAVYENYCCSRGISEQTKELIDEIRNNSQNRYEVLKNLEARLKGMEYSTDCGALPASVSDAGGFLDYFLFTSQKGYCMHFATAFVLMANEMGIPCRYVQGYNVRRGTDGHISVTQNCAHAWPEAYFDNVGWIAFEPTPGYTAPTAWAVNGSVPYVPEPESSDSEHTEPEMADDLPDEPGKQHEVIPPLLLIVPTLAVVGFLIILFIFSRLLSRRTYHRMSDPDKFRYLTKQNLRLLGYLGYRMKMDETLAEYEVRIRQSDSQEIIQHLGFIPVYEALLYSDREITEENVRYAESITSALRGLVRKSKLRYRFLLLLQKS